ncbi:MAG: hypothetical protein R2744_01455 [Bacteroidales bacterium]
MTDQGVLTAYNRSVEGNPYCSRLRRDCIHDHIFKTPSGRIELLSQEAEGRWKLTLFQHSQILYRNTLRALYHITPNNRNRIHSSQFGNLDVIRVNDPEPMIQVSVEDASGSGLDINDIV